VIIVSIRDKTLVSMESLINGSLPCGTVAGSGSDWPGSSASLSPSTSNPAIVYAAGSTARRSLTVGPPAAGAPQAGSVGDEFLLDHFHLGSVQLVPPGSTAVSKSGHSAIAERIIEAGALGAEYRARFVLGSDFLA
jgi:hypothetical protein